MGRSCSQRVVEATVIWEMFVKSAFAEDAVKNAAARMPQRKANIRIYGGEESDGSSVQIIAR